MKPTDSAPDDGSDAKALNKGVAPVTYGTGERPPRGDYSSARSDYTCEQHWERYTAEEHDLYRRLYERQSAQLLQHGARLGSLGGGASLGAAG